MTLVRLFKVFIEYRKNIEEMEYHKKESVWKVYPQVCTEFLETERINKGKVIKWKRSVYKKKIIGCSILASMYRILNEPEEN